ncbi:MAG: hypothetical protein NUW37_13010 [Planctomycetes bacterium]|nr:hypothetical protein [Planctomycetota bacterium]
MVLVSGSSIYNKWPEFALQGQTQLIPVIHHNDGTLEFDSPDPSISITGVVTGDFVTIDVHQILSDEETNHEFEGNVLESVTTINTRISKLGRKNESAVKATIQGTYSGSGYLKFYNDTELLTDFGFWEGTFSATVLFSISFDPRITLSEELSAFLERMFQIQQDADLAFRLEIAFLLDSFDEDTDRVEAHRLERESKERLKGIHDTSKNAIEDVFAEARAYFESIRDSIPSREAHDIWVEFVSIKNDILRNLRESHRQFSGYVSNIGSYFLLNNNQRDRLCDKFVDEWLALCAEFHNAKTIQDQADENLIVADILRSALTPQITNELGAKLIERQVITDRKNKRIEEFGEWTGQSAYLVALREYYRFEDNRLKDELEELTRQLRQAGGTDQQIEAQIAAVESDRRLIDDSKSIINLTRLAPAKTVVNPNNPSGIRADPPTPGPLTEKHLGGVAFLGNPVDPYILNDADPFVINQPRHIHRISWCNFSIKEIENGLKNDEKEAQEVDEAIIQLKRDLIDLSLDREFAQQEEISARAKVSKVEGEIRSLELMLSALCQLLYICE